MGTASSFIKSFPKTKEEFKRLFPDEETSLRFLFSTRWPHGFVCSYCNWVNEEQVPARTITCCHCGHPTSITTNTIMHGTKKTLSEWLLCIWWFSVAEAGHSAKDLQRFLKLSSYQTAWTWLQKLRMAMAASDSRQCRGTVEISSSTISLGGESRAEAPILAAAEIILPAGIAGRVKMNCVEELTSDSVNTFVSGNILPGSSLILPDLEPFKYISRENFVAISATASDRSREIIRSFEIWLNRTHRGGVVAKHLQLYLDEFCFRSNAAMLGDTEAVFNLLLSGVISNKPLSYKSITSVSNKE
ncbi:MAG: IS1595 family transposase [Thermodesulfobacteriota bacterium]